MSLAAKRVLVAADGGCQRALIAGIVAGLAAIVLRPADLITQILIFVPVFILAMVALWLASKLNIVNPKS